MVHLKILAKWLQKEDSNIASGIDWQREQAKIDTKREIGDMIDEILALSDEQLSTELKN